jgi:hypothetical protein
VEIALKTGLWWMSFIQHKGGMDYGRFPVLMPYEMVTCSEDVWMTRSVDTSGLNLNIPGARDINELDSVIFAYGKKTILDFQDVDAAWFVIIPERDVFRGFRDHQGYLNYIDSIGFRDEPKLYHAFDVFKYFDKHDTVDWKGISRSLEAVR